MAEPSNAPPAEEEEQAPASTRDKVGLFFKEKFSLGKEELLKQGTAQYLKGKQAAQRSIGLGPKPSVIPPGEGSISGEYRTVEIGWHPVPGMSWVGESVLGRMINKEVKTFPSPTEHWGVIVGDYGHQLWMDEHLDVIYINEVVKREDWKTYVVGRTRFNDEALRQASEMVIHNMRKKRPAYNLITNNCQSFAVNLLDAIKIGSHREFGTTFAIYQRATGAGRIRDLFDEEVDQKLDVEDKPELERHDTVQQAQQVMDEKTTKLDLHDKPFT